MDYPTRVLALDRERWVMIANIAVKIALVTTFLVAIIVQPSGAQGKGMEYRAPIFIGSAIFVPLIAIKRKWVPFPHTADALLATPFLLDTVANTAGFYERFNATDDVSLGGEGGLALTYSDTVGDLLLSSTGGLIGTVLSVSLLGPGWGTAEAT